MKKVDVIEVLIKVRKELDTPSNTLNDAGICKIARHVLQVNGYTNKDITYFEKFLLKHKPSNHHLNKYREFTDSPFWVDALFWWKVMLYFPETRKIRLAYIDKLIANLK